MRRSLIVPPCFLAMSLISSGCGARSAPDTADAAPATRSTSSSASGADTAGVALVVSTMHRVYDGFVTRDPKAIDAAVPASGMIYVDPAGVVLVSSPAGTEEMVKACAVRRYAMDSVQTSAPAPGIALLTFKLTIDESCGDQKTPSPVYVQSTWQRQDGTWRALAFSAIPAAGSR